MLLALGIGLAFQVQIQIGGDHKKTVVRDSVGDTTLASSRHKVGRRLPVTAAVVTSAFHDPTARALFARARAARLNQDSSLEAYDAQTYQRISAGMGFARIGRDRLLYRTDAAARVHWRRGVGAWVELTGARSVMPALGMTEDDKELEHDLNDDDLSPVPYYPGYEQLWIGGSTAKAQVDETEIVHPLADGAEAYYTYETGDSVTFRLPDGKSVQLRELRVRPRVPNWNVAVGSLWFDVSSGQLVRAAYRLAVPIDVWSIAKAEDPRAMDDVPIWVKPMISPIKAQISAIAIEYGLYETRFWLPRVRTAEGTAQVSFMHVPFRMEQSFKYLSVNGRDSLPAHAVAALAQAQKAFERDSAERALRETLDSAGVAELDRKRDARRRAQRDSADRPCARSDRRIETEHRAAGLVVATSIPCDIATLANSPDLPGSIFDPGDQLFDARARDALVAEALALGAQPPLMLGHLPPPTVTTGLELMRFNRVEGLSAGAAVDEELGGGYHARGVGRLGLGDVHPNVEVTFARTNLSETIRVAGYTRLVSAGDWGRPLSFGSSLAALLFGRDEGFYYYATGAELGVSRAAFLGHGATVEWRGFVENQHSAAVHSRSALNGAAYPANVVAQGGWYGGGTFRLDHSLGLDPNGFRLLSDLRLEGVTGDSTYGRAALDLTGSHGLGPLAAALTMSGGSSLGGVPAQRRWYLGGSQTVRGQSPDTSQSGNAYWFARAEIGASSAGFRPTVFGDLGWVGDRTKLHEIGRPMSGVGIGASMVDGLIRFDVARGLYPRRQWRVDLSLESRF